MTGANERIDAPRRIGLIGVGGQLGQCLRRRIDAMPGVSIAFALTRAELDLADLTVMPGVIDALLDPGRAKPPDVVINAAAHTQVDRCESERDLAYRVNALAPGEWARALNARGIRFIHVSTDYVFSGEGQVPYRETDPTDPRTVYGASKRAGEVAVLGAAPEALVVRTSWVFGPGRNFPIAILDQAHKRRTGEAEGPLRVVDDQRGVPTSADDLSEALLALAGLEPSRWQGGLLHLRNQGETTWFGFAQEILRQAGYTELPIEPVSTDAFPTPAQRPAFSVLDCGLADSRGIRLPAWEDALGRYLHGSDCPYDLAAPSGVSGGGAAPEYAGGSFDETAREETR
jgi:dTDP-4-dehydrorhamnose reductase